MPVTALTVWYVIPQSCSTIACSFGRSASGALGKPRYQSPTGPREPACENTAVYILPKENGAGEGTKSHDSTTSACHVIIAMGCGMGSTARHHQAHEHRAGAHVVDSRAQARYLRRAQVRQRQHRLHDGREVRAAAALDQEYGPRWIRRDRLCQPNGIPRGGAVPVHACEPAASGNRSWRRFRWGERFLLARERRIRAAGPQIIHNAEVLPRLRA